MLYYSNMAILSHINLLAASLHVKSIYYKLPIQFKLVNFAFGKLLLHLLKGAQVDIQRNSNPDEITSYKYQPKILNLPVRVKCWWPLPIL